MSEYLKDEINDIGKNTKNKNTFYLYRSRNEFKKGYKPHSNLVKDVNSNLLKDSHNILNS
jgi:hypothetical protein